MPALEGRVALVTGVGRRIAIGAAIARRLVADGAAVFVHSWSRTTPSSRGAPTPAVSRPSSTRSGRRAGRPST